MYAEGTQLTRVSGHVLRWRKDTERTEEIDAKTYIKDCEAEISRLRAQAANLGDQAWLPHPHPSCPRLKEAETAAKSELGCVATCQLHLSPCSMYRSGPGQPGQDSL